MTINDADKLRAVVREHYGKAATEAGTGCCGGSRGACCGDPGPTSAAFGQTLYQIGDREALPDASVDVIISNCVVNLAADKGTVFREAFRVLRPGGRLAISDIVLRRPLPPELAELMGLWTGCIAGALPEAVCRDELRTAGFQEIDIEPTNVLSGADLGD